MGASQFIFIFLSTLTLAAALGVIISKKPLNSILWMMVVCFTLTGHFILMNAQFMAIVNLIVFAGAIPALFIIVVVFINFKKLSRSANPIYLKVAGVLSALVLMILLITAVAGADNSKTLLRKGTGVGLTENLGKLMFHKYVIPFEIISLVFLSAVIGVIIISRKDSLRN